MMLKALLLLLFFSASLQAGAQTWTDSLDNYAREKYLPPQKFRWTWQHASLLYTMISQYGLLPESERDKYLAYIRSAMDRKSRRANGKRPNAVASASGMAFLYRVTGEKKYMDIAKRVFGDYQKIPRTSNGGVSHLRNSPELWDDTVYMVGIFLLEMYRATGDAAYLEELALQFRAHREKLIDEEWGLWYHGWDDNNKNHCALCGQRNWPDKVTRRSAEIWGRGTGWILVTLSEILRAIPEESPYYAEFSGYLEEMVVRLPEIQDKATGHWLQLPVRTDEPGNFIESSCTAMFAYGILSALQLGIISGEAYSRSVEMAYQGLREHSTMEVSPGYLATKNVCKGTCIGDMQYYLNRKTNSVKPSGMAMFILFGRNYEMHFQGHP